MDAGTNPRVLPYKLKRNSNHGLAQKLHSFRLFEARPKLLYPLNVSPATVQLCQPILFIHSVQKAHDRAGFGTRLRRLKTRNCIPNDVHTWPFTKLQASTAYTPISQPHASQPRQAKRAVANNQLQNPAAASHWSKKVQLALNGVRLDWSILGGPTNVESVHDVLKASRERKAIGSLWSASTETDHKQAPAPHKLLMLLTQNCFTNLAKKEAPAYSLCSAFICVSY